MASLGGNILPPGMPTYLQIIPIAAVLILGACLFSLLPKLWTNEDKEHPGLLRALCVFCYGCFLKPHDASTKGSQQDALESFYKTQAGAYDLTRRALLKGREDMLALAAAQLAHKAKQNDDARSNVKQRRVWVDVGGGTGFNIEAMSEFVDVPTFFDSVYLVDFSPSLCEVARKRFQRLGWKNVKVVCEDARNFHLEDHEPVSESDSKPNPVYASNEASKHKGADLITLSYSLSMIPDYYSVIDSLQSLLGAGGILGVVDFYVQSQADVSFRNYTGGHVNRHVNYFARTFWRAWFDLDRVTLESGRRDYLEYQFGTVLSVNNRNYSLGAIPYYVWLGCQKVPAHEVLQKIDASITGSPCLQPSLSRTIPVGTTEVAIHSKAFDAAVVNLSAHLPLPSSFYQNQHWRVYYDDQLQKHTQFKNEYIYAFTWEDTRVDEQILNLTADDVVLAITSAGDNILSYALKSPARIHAVDLNPTQNHLLELKLAAYAALSYADFFKIFGEGRHPAFRSLLVSKLSPYLSSRAFQFWFNQSKIFCSAGGLYDTGGSKWGIRLFRWVSYVFGIRGAVKDMLASTDLTSQRQIWQQRIRPSLLSKLVSTYVVSQESFLWTALGVPKNQLAILEQDHAVSPCVTGSNPRSKNTRSHAIWEYMVNTLDPMAEQTHIASDNPYYHVCLAGQFNSQCHPEYLTRSAHAALSQTGAFDNLRIHTDELCEVLSRLSPGTLSVAVVMDSMDWFSPQSPHTAPKTKNPAEDPAHANTESSAANQIKLLNRALKLENGRVMLRSSGLRPWYIDEFEKYGFDAECIAAREPGTCIDRVNMYASCWLLHKRQELADLVTTSSKRAETPEFVEL